MTKKLYNYRHILALAAFILIHTVTCFFTTYFGDDYYYAAFIKNGPEYMLSENLLHYMQTNGRALVHLIDEILIGINFNVWRVSAVLLMTGLAVIMAKLASRQYRKDADREIYKNSLIAVLAIFSFTDIAILRQTVYWATGALNYLYPATLTLLYVYLARRAYERGRGFFPLAALAFVGSATTEQASAALLLAALWLGVTAVISKNYKLILPVATNIIASAAGLSTLLLAPGTAARTQFYPEFYSMNIFERILHNASELIWVVFGKGGMGAVILTAMIVIVFRSYKKSPLLSIICGISATVYSYCLITGTDILANIFIPFIIAIPLITALVYSLWDYFKNKETDNLYFLFGAVAMQCAMAISPEFGARTLTVSLLLLIVPVARAIIESPSGAFYATLAAASGLLLLSNLDIHLLALFAPLLASAVFILAKLLKFKPLPTLAVIIALLQFVTVPMGYGKNLETHALNKKQIENYDPTADIPLTLYYLPNPTHKYTMPYDDKYHEYMLLVLCDLPGDTEVVYEWLQK